MLVLVTGSRVFRGKPLLFRELDKIYHAWQVGSSVVPFEPFTLMHGECPYGGADLMAQEWAEYRNRTREENEPPIVIEPHPPNFEKYGSPDAFRVRNREMVERNPDLCVAFFQEGALNRGTGITVAMCYAAGVHVEPFVWRGASEEWAD